MAPRAFLSSFCVFVIACGETPSATQSGPRPNLLLVSVDCLRADHLSCYGYERQTSPTLDALAAEGVRFERALSSSPWTLPAHLTMLTGLPVSAHGVDDDRLWSRTDRSGKPLPPPLKGVFVAEPLRAAGYRTAGFYSWKYLEPRFGFGPGFETWERKAHTFYSHPEVGPLYERLRAAGDLAGQQALVERYPTLFDDTHPSSPEVIDAAADWLDERASAGDDDPFFLFVHLFDVHDPYHPPEPYYSLFADGYEGEIDGRRVTTRDSPVVGDMPARDLERLVSLYDGAIRFVDSEIGRLLAKLEKLGLKQNTLVVVTADHGEEFFEHGHKTHRRQVYLESISVPLILRWPAGLPSAGRVVQGNVGLVDVTPTLYAAAGVRSPVPTLGVDLLPLARGEQVNGTRTYLSELLLFDQGPVPQRILSLVRGEEQRLLTTRGVEPWSAASLNLAQDPLGRGRGRTLDAEGQRRLTEDLASLREALLRLRSRQPARGGSLQPLEARELAELAAMGYAGHEDPDAADGDGARLSFDGGVWPDR